MKTLDDKKYVALEFIKLGMDSYSAMIQADCTDEEIKLLEEDEVFMRDVEFKQKLEERQLLEKLDIAIEMGVSKGNISGITWKLERLNPRWQARSSIQQTTSQNTVEIYLPDNGRGDS